MSKYLRYKSKNRLLKYILPSYTGSFHDKKFIKLYFKTCAFLEAQLVKNLSNGFYPWVEKIPWRMEKQLTPGF